MLDVAVDHPDFAKLIRCECKERELEQSRQQRTRAALERLRGEMGRLKDCSFESFRPDWSDVSAFNTTLAVTLATCRQYAAHPKGWLYLWGSYGTGKSHLAAAIANTLVERGVETAYASLPHLMRFLRQGIRPRAGEPSADERLEMLSRVTFLVLDDIGAEYATEWSREQLFELVNERYRADLPMVYTSNARPEDAIREARVVDRIYGMATVLALSGPSYRRRDPDGSLASCL